MSLHTRFILADECGDCHKVGRVFVDPHETDDDTYRFTVRQGDFKCEKRADGTCFKLQDYDFDRAIEDAHKDVESMNSAEVQLCSAISGLALDIESQDQLRQLAGNCAPCLFTIGKALGDKFADRDKESVEVEASKIRDLIKEERPRMAEMHKQHRNRRCLYSRIIRLPGGEGCKKRTPKEKSTCVDPKKKLTPEEKNAKLAALVENVAKAKDEASKRTPKVSKELVHNAMVRCKFYQCPICDSKKSFTDPGLWIHLGKCLGHDFPDFKKTKLKIMQCVEALWWTDIMEYCEYLWYWQAPKKKKKRIPRSEFIDDEASEEEEEETPKTSKPKPCKKRSRSPVKGSRKYGAPVKMRKLSPLSDVTSSDDDTIINGDSSGYKPRYKLNKKKRKPRGPSKPIEYDSDIYDDEID